MSGTLVTLHANYGTAYDSDLTACTSNIISALSNLTSHNPLTIIIRVL